MSLKSIFFPKPIAAWTEATKLNVEIRCKRLQSVDKFVSAVGTLALIGVTLRSCYMISKDKPIARNIYPILIVAAALYAIGEIFARLHRVNSLEARGYKPGAIPAKPAAAPEKKPAPAAPSGEEDPLKDEIDELLNPKDPPSPPLAKLIAKPVAATPEVTNPVPPAKAATPPLPTTTAAAGSPLPVLPPANLGPVPAPPAATTPLSDPAAQPEAKPAPGLPPLISITDIPVPADSPLLGPPATPQKKSDEVTVEDFSAQTNPTTPVTPSTPSTALAAAAAAPKQRSRLEEMFDTGGRPANLFGWEAGRPPTGAVDSPTPATDALSRAAKAGAKPRPPIVDSATPSIAHAEPKPEPKAAAPVPVALPNLGSLKPSGLGLGGVDPSILKGTGLASLVLPPSTPDAKSAATDSAVSSAAATPSTPESASASASATPGSATGSEYEEITESF